MKQSEAKKKLKLDPRFLRGKRKEAELKRLKELEEKKDEKEN